MLAIDLTINGLIIGVFYALMAIGLSLIFGVLKVVNFAHGEFYMVGAYAYTLTALMLGLSPWLSLPEAARLRKNSPEIPPVNLEVNLVL